MVKLREQPDGSWIEYLRNPNSNPYGDTIEGNERGVHLFADSDVARFETTIPWAAIDRVRCAPIDWSSLSPELVAAALDTIPKKVAYAWERSPGDGWHRLSVYQPEQEPPWVGVVGPLTDGFCAYVNHQACFHATLPGAQAAVDEWLQSQGWVLTNAPSQT